MKNNHFFNTILALVTLSFIGCGGGTTLTARPPHAPVEGAEEQIHDSTIKVGTYNIGIVADYRNQLVRSGQEKQLSPALDQAFQTAIKNGAANLGANEFHKITGEERKVIEPLRNAHLKQLVENSQLKMQDILLLQEVKTQEDLRLLGNLLKSVGFEYRYGRENGRTDTFVAWKKKRFSILNDRTSNFVKTASVYLQDNVTKKTIRVASAHISGFNISQPEPEKCKEGDKMVRAYTAFLEQKDKEGKRADIDIIGGDFNSEFYPKYVTNEDLYKMAIERFRILNEDEHFSFLQNKEATAYNPNRNRASLDHFFYRSNSKAPIEVKQVSSEIPVCDIEKNPSDHAPVFIEIQLKS